MKEGTTFIGLDAHKKTIQVCLLRSNREETLEWQVVNEPGAARRMAKKILKEAQGEVLSCYEAGPCGYVLQRQLRGAGVTCQVIAPSLIPVKPGDRIKTDKRDARKLSEKVAFFRRQGSAAIDSDSIAAMAFLKVPEPLRGE